jgi:hypothetical protein
MALNGEWYQEGRVVHGWWSGGLAGMQERDRKIEARE